MNILHIGHSKGWRGGENQARLLIEGLINSFPEVHNFIAYPKSAQIIQRLEPYVKGVLEFSSTQILSFRALYRLVKFCRLNNIDVLHAHSAKAHSLAYFAKSFLPNLKVVVHRRVDNSIKGSYFTRKKYLSEKIDAWLAVSDKTYAMLESYGVDSERMYLVKDGIPEQKYNFPDKQSAKNNLIQAFGWHQKDMLIGFVSAVDNQKNPLLFVDMIAQLKRDGILCNAVIAGTGKLEEAVKDKITALGLSETIKLLGFVGNVQDIFQGLDVFVLPSRNEGLGTVLLEAALAESVIVASDVGGIGEVVKHKKTGFLASSCDVDTFVESVDYIVQNQDQVNLIKHNAKKYVELNFNLKSVVSKTRDVYLHVLS
jgi:glycosyltransferase involved in cell wall biosynthesis